MISSEMLILKKCHTRKGGGIVEKSPHIKCYQSYLVTVIVCRSCIVSSSQHYVNKIMKTLSLQDNILCIM